jgi:hypothetical protein
MPKAGRSWRNFMTRPVDDLANAFDFTERAVTAIAEP